MLIGLPAIFISCETTGFVLVQEREREREREREEEEIKRKDHSEPLMTWLMKFVLASNFPPGPFKSLFTSLGGGSCTKQVSNMLSFYSVP